MPTERVALVTGGNKGVGEGIARALAARGHKVAVLGRDAAALARVAGDIGGLALEADVTDRAALDRALAKLRETLGAPSIVVSNAGVEMSAALAATTDEMWDRVMATNVTSAFRVARAVVPDMVKAGWGRLIHLASNAGLTGYSYTSAYCASKHAMVGLARALAHELARTGVTVNSVCPGFVDTEMVTRAAQKIVDKTGRSTDEARKALAELSPQKRLVTVEEVTHVVLMLCDEASQAVNGQAIAIDGGQVMR